MTTIRPPPVWVLGAMGGAGLFASGMALPSIPAIAQGLDTSTSLAQTTVTVFLAAMAASMLVVGPMSDRRGRLGLARACAWMLLLAGIASCAAPNITSLLIARTVQGLAAGGLGVLSRAMLRDHFTDDTAMRASATTSMIMGIAPIVAIPLGGLLQQALGWRWNMGCITLMSVVVLWAVLRRLDETHPEAHRVRAGKDAGIASVLAGYAALLVHSRFMAVTLPVMWFSVGLFAYHTAAPVIMIKDMDATPTEYGLWATLGTIGFIAGNLAMLRLTRRIHADTVMHASYWGALVACAAMIGGALWLPAVPATLAIPGMMFTFCNGLMQSNAILAGSSAVPGRVGAASAMSSFLRMAGTAAGSLIVALLPWHSPIVVGCVYLVAGVASIAGWIWLRGESAREAG